MSHYGHPLYTVNSGSFYPQDPIPLPPTDGLHVQINTYDDVPEEPKFDPAVHLDLQRPRFIRLLPTYEKSFKFVEPKEGGPSPFAWSSPFQVRRNDYFLVR